MAASRILWGVGKSCGKSKPYSESATTEGYVSQNQGTRSVALNINVKNLKISDALQLNFILSMISMVYKCKWRGWELNYTIKQLI
ncbi:hypothetical protein [Falsochrobactrum shanghaiense]|uniref:hypothetical protein n=1 Tax=Falsochrobactrum shanghaiense TaxID=2201899 RepID=UPI0011B27E46|nr:hypothetical protein [Falsochrobactrum shanghaiense]